MFDRKQKLKRLEERIENIEQAERCRIGRHVWDMIDADSRTPYIKMQVLLR